MTRLHLPRGLALALLAGAAAAALTQAPRAAAETPTPPSQPRPGWKRVDAPDAGFSAWYPGQPERMAFAKGDVQVVGYGLDIGNPKRSFLVVMVTGDADAARKTIDEGLLRAIVGKDEIRREEQGVFDGHPGRALVIGGGTTGTIRRFTAYGRQYLVAVGGVGKPVDESDAKAFLDSVRIVERLEPSGGGLGVRGVAPASAPRP